MKKLLFALTAFVMGSISMAGQDIDSLMATMTLRQKVAQLFVPAVGATANKSQDAEYLEWVKEGIGGMIIMDGNLIPCMERINMLQGSSRIPMLISIDGEWGMSMRFPEFPYFPRQMQLGALDNERLVYRMGRAVGKEMRLIHVGVNFAPVVDINVEPANPVINNRSFGEDRQKVASYGWAYARGMQDEGVSACIKHFPGHGDTKVDSHSDLPVLTFDRKRLDSLELYPFKYAIRHGIDFVMTAHLSVPALDPTGMPTSVSKAVVTDLLRGELGFKGLVVTDALGMAGVREFYKGDGPQTSLAAYKAGSDMLVMPKDLVGGIDLICEAVKSGEISEEGLDMRVRKILELKKRQGMFSKEFRSGVNLDGLVEAADSRENKELIAEISRRSLVLVQNEKGILPVLAGSKEAAGGKVAYLALGAGIEKRVIPMDVAAGFDTGVNKDMPAEGSEGGPSAYGARRGIGASGATVLSGILEENLGVDSYFLDRGFTLDQLKEMRKKLSRYKTVIVGFHDTDSRPQNNFGIDAAIYDYVGEWAGRQKLVGVYCGNPYALDKMPWYKKFRGFVIAWADNAYNCSAAGQAICGLIPFKGVLPVRAGGLPVGYSAAE